MVSEYYQLVSSWCKPQVQTIPWSDDQSLYPYWRPIRIHIQDKMMQRLRCDHFDFIHGKMLTNAVSAKKKNK